MGRTREQQREYMRKYRARKKAAYPPTDDFNAGSLGGKWTPHSPGGTYAAIDVPTRSDGRVSASYFADDDGMKLRAQVALLGQERDALLEEVRHLKAELAKRPAYVAPSFGTPRPAPKPGRVK